MALLHSKPPDGSAAKRQAAEEAAKANKNKERLQQMFAKAAGALATPGCCTAHGRHGQPGSIISTT
jgi:hypothetical protein